MNLLTDEIEKKIQTGIIKPASQKKYGLTAKNISVIIDDLYANIPDKRRISYGIVYTIDTLIRYLYEHIEGKIIYHAASEVFQLNHDFRSKAVALGLLSYYGLENHKKVLPFFETAAADEHWGMREMAAHFLTRLTKKYPAETKRFLLKCVKSKDPNIRRFVSETLRPVGVNRWLLKNPKYSLSVLKHLFKESVAYPRTSVGNNLSDLAKQHPELVYGLVKELVESSDKNSYRIAYRACRNLVKREPEKVMDLLRVDEYKYKKNIYKRNDNGNTGKNHPAQA